MDWFNKLTTASKVMVVGVAVLFLAVIILLPVAILTHHEAGLLTACDTPNGNLNYDGSCYEVTWDRSQFPLTVSVSTTNPYPPANPTDATRSAVDLINSRLGFTALEMATAADSDIRIDFEAAQEVNDPGMRDPGGSALHHRDHGHLWCQIRTWNNGTIEMTDKALVHELGHCLGLAHDDFSDSAMYPSLHPDGDHVTRPRITDFDRGILREHYN